MNTGTVSVDLSFNKISILENNAFENVPCLETVVISDNDIKLVKPEVFWGLQGLRHIDMHNSNVDYVHPNTFKNNRNLSTLDLSCNKLKSLLSDFNSSNELKFLNLSSNKLTFKGLVHVLPISSLQILDLSNNEIETLNKEVFSGMVNLKLLNISGNPRLEYDCHVRSVRTLCAKQNITCVAGDEQSFKMVDNLNCDTEERPKASSLTEEADEFINTGEYGTEGSVNEGSGTEPNESISDNQVKKSTSTLKVFNQSIVTPEDHGKLTGIIVGSVASLVLVVVAGFLIRRYRCREETSGNFSRTNSISYLDTNTEEQLGNRNTNVRSNYSAALGRTNLATPNRTILMSQDSGSLLAEMVRVPSFKTRVSAPLNLPEEISVQETALII
jgi:hypothetical protein